MGYDIGTGKTLPSARMTANMAASSTVKKTSIHKAQPFHKLSFFSNLNNLIMPSVLRKCE
jgi:hypothetical protein